jgi:hypothetical protein
MNLRERLRKQWESRYDHYYVERGRPGDPCTYCGQMASGYDHVPPLAYVAGLADVEDGLRSIRPRKVPACAECNCILGAQLFMTQETRRRHVKEKLRKRYAKFVSMPKWDDDELAELSPDFAEEIRRASKFAEHIKRRLDFY